jgi:transposase
MQSPKLYSEDLRRRIVLAVEGGTSRSAAARLFGVSLSSVKRYLRLAERGMPLTPRKGGGRPPKTDQTVEKLLKEDVKEHPAATASQRRRFLEHTTGKALSDSTVKRLLKRLGFSQKKDYGGAGARRMAKGRMEGYGHPGDRHRAACIRGRDGDQHLSSLTLRLVTER